MSAVPDTTVTRRSRLAWLAGLALLIVAPCSASGTGKGCPETPKKLRKTPSMISVSPSVSNSP